MANLQLFAKGGLLILIIVSIAVLIERLTDGRRLSIDFEEEVINAASVIDNTTVSPDTDIEESRFSKKFSECLTLHSKFHYYPINQASTRKKIIAARYRVLRFEGWINFDQMNIDESKNVTTFHYFIIRKDTMMHLIVLNPRGSYLWSPSFNTSEIRLKGLQYVNDRAFENFTTSPVPVYFDTLSSAQIFLPSDIRCFLLDVMASSFLKCKAISSNVINPQVHSKVVMALKELKRVLNSQMITFWLWSKTLQGWFEKCDVLQYSEELKFSVAAKSVYGYNFTLLFNNSECQHVESYFNLNSSIKNIKLNCHEVPVDLVFMYEDQFTNWYEHVEGQNTYRLKFPKFSICSTDIFGQKIGIPCKTSEMLEGEYGQFLKNTTFILDSGNMPNVLLMDKYPISVSINFSVL